MVLQCAYINTKFTERISVNIVFIYAHYNTICAVNGGLSKFFEEKFLSYVPSIEGRVFKPNFHT